MTRLERPAPVRPAAMCCQRAMSMIEVTSPPGSGGGTLALHTCASCGRHVWERDGQVLEGDQVLAAVKARVADGPPPRSAGPRGPRPPRATPAPSPPARAVAVRPEDEVRRRLEGFTILGA